MAEVCQLLVLGGSCKVVTIETLIAEGRDTAFAKLIKSGHICHKHFWRLIKLNLGQN